MTKKAFVAFSLGLLGVLLSIHEVRADAPPLIPIQGYLADAAGTPIDGGLKIRFRLYDADKAGTVLFDEIKPVVSVVAGYFTVYLGEATAIDLSVFRMHPVVYVGVLVGADTAELSPRLQLATAPYAAFAQSCGDAATFQGKGPSDFQSRVSSSCSGANQSIKTIGSDGTTTCETDDVGPTYTAGTGIKMLANKLGLSCQWESRAGSECAAGVQCDVVCATGFVLTGGCDGVGTTTVQESYPLAKDNNYKTVPSGPWPVSASPSDPNVPFMNGWGCQPSSGGTFNGVYALCCDL